MLILDLCGGTGAWSDPYRAAGYRVDIIDPRHDGRDVRLLQRVRAGVWGILAAPPCTKFAVSGNGTRAKEKRAGTYDAGIQDALSIVDACIRIAWVQAPKWWALENPVGTLGRYLGPPRLMFDPSDYGDPYTKKTLLWGTFTPTPMVLRVPASQGSKMHPDAAERGACDTAQHHATRLCGRLFRGQPVMEQGSFFQGCPYCGGDPTEPNHADHCDGRQGTVEARLAAEDAAKAARLPTFTDAPDFDGETYERARDHARLNAQLARVLTVLKDGQWHTLAGLSAQTGDPEASISARVRDLRKEKFGGYVVERRYVESGLFEYRLLMPEMRHAS